MTNIFTTANAEALKAANDAQREAEKALREAHDAMRTAQARVEFIHALYAEDYSYARTDTFRGEPSHVRLYRRDPESPSGVSCMASLNWAEAVPLMEAAGRR